MINLGVGGMINLEWGEGDKPWGGGDKPLRGGGDKPWDFGS